MNPAEAKSYLNSFINYENKRVPPSKDTFKLTRLKKLLQLIGNPEKKFKIIHVAGTNGKGSVCAFISSILKQAGYKVGLYTSPHIHSVNERIRVIGSESRDGADDFPGAVSDEIFAERLTELESFITEVHQDAALGKITYFELLTAAALLHFSRAGVDMAVLEVGLGGRLDATNVVDSDVCVITQIGLDHTQFLGNTLKEIAKEKAAIIKDSNSRVIIMDQDEEVLCVLNERCRDFSIVPVQTGESNKTLSLSGPHQKKNAAAAEAAVKAVVTVTDQDVEDGLKYTTWPCRFEEVSRDPTVIIDSAHNPSAAKTLAETIKTAFAQPAVLIVGFSDDKDVAEILKQLQAAADDIIITRAENPRSLDPKAIDCSKCCAGKGVSVILNVKDAVEAGMRMANGRPVVIAGSIYLASQARGLFKKQLTTKE